MSHVNHGILASIRPPSFMHIADSMPDDLERFLLSRFKADEIDVFQHRNGASECTFGLMARPKNPWLLRGVLTRSMSAPLAPSHIHTVYLFARSVWRNISSLPSELNSTVRLARWTKFHHLVSNPYLPTRRGSLLSITSHCLECGFNAHVFIQRLRTARNKSPLLLAH